VSKLASLPWATFLLFALAATTAVAAQERTLEQVKAEVLQRTAGNTPPFDRLRRAEVQDILATLSSLEPNQWGEQWCQAGLGHEAKGDALLKQGAPAGQVGEEYYLAYGYCHVGRYPVASTPGKLEAYRNMLRMFRKAAKYFDTPLEVVEIPFEGKQLVGYLQKPAGVARPPVVMYWGGVDVWKEDHQRNAQIMHRQGLATFLIDGPGTGENPLRFAEPQAERTFLAAMDYLKGRSDIDGSRIALWGRSFGAYWVAKIAHMYPGRIKGGVVHGGNVHFGFQEAWLKPAMTENAANYLLGPSSLYDSRSYAMGVKSLDEFMKVAPSLSLLDMGLLDKPSAPLLVVNGKLDDQAPIADSYLLLEHGTPKLARIYPEGGHMGVQRGVNPDIIATMIAQWLQEAVSR
jgi:pimeloyl-ACP methyl ester carboxylesterase